ncbi:MAG TPA: hypothetical protein V6D05_05160 [Stenomitos sp.]
MKRLLAALGIAGVFWGAQALCLGQLVTVKAEHPSRLVVPNPQIAKVLVSDFENLAADLLWIQSLQHNGDQLIDDEEKRDFRGMYEALDLASDFDPRFHELTTFGSWMLADGKRTPEAIRLLEKGQARYPDLWMYPYQLGFIEFLYAKDYLKAAQHFDQAAALPNCPPSARHMAAGLYAKGNKRDLAVATWQAIYERGDDRVRGIARRALKRLGVAVPE